MNALPHAVLLATLLAAPAVAAQTQVRLPERDRPLAGEAPVVFAVGRAEGADHEMFGSIGGVAFDGGDNLYVLDSQAARVMAYDPAGRFLRQVGRRGEGPGELTRPSSLAVAPDGTLFVRHRPGVAVFGSDGRYLETRPVGDWAGLGLPGLQWHPGGGVLAVASGMPTSFEAGTQFDRAVLVHFPSGGGDPAPVFHLPQGWTTVTIHGEGGRRSRRMSGPAIFAAQATFGTLPDGTTALSITNGYTVRIVGLDGTTHRYLQRPMRVRLTTEADRERARQRVREEMRVYSGSGTSSREGAPEAAVLERSIAQLQFSDTVAAIRALRTAPSGTIWVERSSETYYDPGPIDLITAAGEYRGTLTGEPLPAAISRGGLAAYLEPDEYDVPRVVVRRLPAAWR